MRHPKKCLTRVTCTWHSKPKTEEGRDAKLAKTLKSTLNTTTQNLNNKGENRAFTACGSFWRAQKVLLVVGVLAVVFPAGPLDCSREASLGLDPAEG